MVKKQFSKLLKEQMKVLDSASAVLQESFERVKPILEANAKNLSIEQRESCEALTARFARLCDFLFQRLFRTLDQIELTDEGTALDRLNRMEKRGIIQSTNEWRLLRDLRNDIVHEYLIESSDEVLKETFKNTPPLIQTVLRLKKYVSEKGYT